MLIIKSDFRSKELLCVKFVSILYWIEVINFKTPCKITDLPLFWTMHQFVGQRF